MTSVMDVWRAIDPEARLLSGSPDRLRAAIRGVARTRALPPHLPDPGEGQLLVVERGVAPAVALDGLVALLREAGLRPVAIVIAGVAPDRIEHERAGDPVPILASARSHAAFADAAIAYLDEPELTLGRAAAELRLAAAEAALADPVPGTPAGLIAGRLRRGVAVAADGALVALNPRPAGRALAARFAAIHARTLAGSPGRSSSRQTREGLHLLERRIRAGASVWLFDDLPFARIDEVAAEALTVTLRALLARPPEERRSRARDLDTAGVARPLPVTGAAAGAPEGEPGVLRETLVAVARANGRVAPAARALGVHRNTVLYRLRRGLAELNLDPRRPDDALRILREADPAADAG